MDEQNVNDDQELKFTRRDSSRLVRIETELSGLKESNDAQLTDLKKSNNDQFKSLHEKLDKISELKEKVASHATWIKIFAWSIGTLITAVAAAAAKSIFF